MDADVALRSEIDRLASRALPAVVQEEREGWLLRASGGLFLRNNSALALCDEPGPAEVVEEFCARHGLPALVQVTRPSVDAGLRHWRRLTDVLVMTGPVPAAEPAVPVQVADAPDEPWARCWWAVDGRAGRLSEALAQLALAEPPSAYASVRRDGEVVAAGRGVLDGGRLGVFAMTVLPHARGQGLGRAVLRGLGGWAAARGASSSWLQVLEDNAPARALYAAEGLAPAYRYWYRTPG